MKNSILTIVTLLLCSSFTNAQNRWSIDNDGRGIVWEVNNNNIPHYDHMEMSGEMMSGVIRYGVDPSGAFVCERSLVFPMLRTIPNDTHASLMHRFAIDPVKLISVNGLVPSDEKVDRISVNGNIFIHSTMSVGKSSIGSPAKNERIRATFEVTRSIQPSTKLPALIERYSIRNSGTKPITVMIPSVSDRYVTDPVKGTEGSYTFYVETTNGGYYILEPGTKPLEFGLTIQAFKHNGIIKDIDINREIKMREAFVNDTIGNTLILNTPDSIINKMFEFAKIRSCESIFKTKGGYMHGPGGESYYAAIWANDQAEYANPFFPFVKYSVGNESALNSFLHFARFINPEYKPMPSSIIAEGTDIWAGAGDRGDAAMIAYGAARYALALGDAGVAAKLWPLIEWCLEYCHRNLNGAGVVKSNADELEGRFPAGDANLCTSSLYYDALISARYLGKELKVSTKKLDGYKKEAEALRTAIEKYFGSDDLGFHTYRYYKGNDKLRSWICIPLTVGIEDRAEGTIKALFSPRLWSENGLLTQEGSTTYWDRSTLYALRGVYAAGQQDKATDYLKRYSATRLLGEHVPYAIEAFPEGDQRHLSAESALYCRIITEGLFGIRPAGFKSFTITPRLPSGWDKMSLKNIAAFGSAFDIQISRESKNEIKVRITINGQMKEYACKDGKTLNISL